MKSCVIETLCDLLCIGSVSRLNELLVSWSLVWQKHCVIYFVLMNYVLWYFYVYQYVTINIWSVNLWTTFDKHKHLMNTKSIVTGWWSYATQQGSVINIITWKCWPIRILTIWWSGVTDNVAAVGPRIYGVKDDQHFSCSYQQTNQDWSLGIMEMITEKKLETKDTHN